MSVSVYKAELPLAFCLVSSFSSNGICCPAAPILVVKEALVYSDMQLLIIAQWWSLAWNALCLSSQATFLMKMISLNNSAGATQFGHLICPRSGWVGVFWVVHGCVGPSTSIGQDKFIGFACAFSHHHPQCFWEIQQNRQQILDFSWPANQTVSFHSNGGGGGPVDSALISPGDLRPETC